MHPLLDKDKPTFIFKEPTSDFLWHGRTLHLLTSFPSEFIDKVIALDKDALATLMDLETLLRYATKHDNQKIISYIMELPGAKDKRYVKAKAQHFLLIMRFLVAVYFLNNPSTEQEISRGILMFFAELSEEINNAIKGYIATYDLHEQLHQRNEYIL